jgi:hypothetical protein
LHRYLILASLLLLVACISSQPFPAGIPLPQPQTQPIVRAPKVGQEWVYEIHNVFNQAIVDIVTERVVSVGEQVRIARSSQQSGQLPDEIQEPWGYVLQDPHWSPPQKFQKPLPLWPEQLTPGWSTFLRTRYQVLGYPDGMYYWGLSVRAMEWEAISVPAGEFTVLRFHNEAPMFESGDLFRLANIRQEDVWLAPEIGRWAIRRSYGRYLLAGVTWNNALWEDYLEWRLVSWK